ncbi:pisatin demethylase / Cytochrome-P450 monooxygenase [Teratosphaeria destructans]|uniref:Pisatin demethylase / Cytochrome-P450 monooxygenase n=1 Tax=Teratosphaeria destructans TaxID=418781 RepID=A0A9W7T163_9PEZI|nr:pisatin demethylase / Cytochrome-P450 monooxygenase [Teratosphaeria destructans]
MFIKSYSEDMTSLSLLSWALVIVVGTLLWRPRRSALHHIPCPDQGFFLYRLFHEPTVRELEQWSDEVPHQGLIRYYGLWNQERIFAASPEAARDLLVVDAYKTVKPELQHILADNISSKGLLILEGQPHKAARKAFQPVFYADQIQRMYPIMWESAFDLVNAVTGQPHRGLQRWIAAASIDIIGRWGFSRRFDALKDPAAGLPRAYLGMFKSTKRGQHTLYAAAIIGPKLALRLPLQAVKTIRRAMALVHRTADQIVTEHERGVPGTDMLNVLMKGERFSHDELVTHSVHMLAAATETVAGTIAWAIHLLSRHPDMQKRLRDEIRQRLPSPRPMDGRVDLQEADFADMKYLDAVIQEVLRFHSINTILWRECVTPARICDTVMPAGTKVVYSPWTLGRDRKHWGADARVFRPERWLEKRRGGADDAYSFLTFGAGPRRCLGETYARAQMRCLIAGLVGRLEFRPVEPGRGSDEGQEIGDQAALTLFKILEGWRINATVLEGW